MAETDNVIAKGSQDLKTIEDFVNLPAGSDVRPRLLPSVNVGTLSGIKDAIFRAGGIPATPFPTRALLITNGTSLPSGSYAFVTDDKEIYGGIVGGNNGVYLKTGNTWAKTNYDPVGMAKYYTDTVKAETLATAALDASTKAAQAQVNAIAASSTDASVKDSAVLAQSKQYTDNAQLALSSSMQATITANVLLSAQAAIDSAAASGGYIIVDSFELGATITKRNQVLRLSANGTFYRWAGALPKTVPAGSTPASSGGIGESGWLLVSMLAKTAYNSMFSLLSDKSSFEDGKMYTTSSFYTGKNTGGGDYVYMSSVDKATANGGSIIDPSMIGTLSSTNVQAQLVDYLNKQGTGVGTGCLVRLFDNEHTAEMYGGLPDIPTFDNTFVFRKIIAKISSPIIKLLKGTYYVKSTHPKVPAINLTNNSTVKGMGMYNSYLKNMDDAAQVAIPIGGYAIQYVTLKDFGVDGNRQRLANAFYNEGEGIDFDVNARNLTIRNIHIKETMGEALDIDSATDVDIDNLYIENCSGNGLHISDGQPPRYCNVSNVTIVNCANGRGMSGDLRSAGLLLRVSSINLSNIIIKDCWTGILHNGQLVPADKKEHANINNIHISGSVNDDIVVTGDASGMTITNFTIKRAATNVYPTTIKVDVGKSFTLSNGDIEATADISIMGLAIYGRTGFNMNNVIAPNCTLQARVFGRSGIPYCYANIGNGCVFSTITLSLLYGFKMTGVTCDNLSMIGLSYNGIITGNIITQNITTDTAENLIRKVMITNNRIGGSVSPILTNNIHCLVSGNMVA